MIKLALLGKDIQHSKSPEIYKRLLKNQVSYDLLDYQNEEDIPDIQKLLSKYLGISITSPYKKHFLNQINLTENASKLEAINCIGIKNEQIIGENSDYLAILNILEKWKIEFGHLNIIILGDGVMSKVTAFALKVLNLEYQVYSRRTVEHFNHINLESIYTGFTAKNHQKLVINTCSRDYIFRGIVGADTIFWDYNYHFPLHSSYLRSKAKKYIDGLEMLELQAKYALAFWSIIPL